MADTTTTYYGLTKPEIGASEDTWGAKLNGDMDLIDTQMKSSDDVSSAALPKAGGTMTGPITTNSTIDGVDIATRDGVLSATKVTADAALPKAGGTMTGDTLHSDGVKNKFGTGGDLEVYHDGTHSYIKDVGAGNLNILTNGVGVVIADTSGNDLAIFNAGNSSVSFNNGGLTKLATTSTGINVTGTVTSDGAVVDGNALVGTSNDAAGAGNTVNGISLRGGSDNRSFFSTTSNYVMSVNRSGSNGTAVVFNKNGGAVGSISVTGTATSFNTSSDYRLKTDWQPMVDATATLMQLNPVNFKWRADNTRVDGFLAHELQAVIPEAASGTHNGMVDEEYEATAATGDIYTAGSDAGFNEVSPEVVGGPAYYDIDGVQIRAEIIAESAVYEAFDAVAEVIHSSDVEQPETLEDGQQWRETTPQVMATRSIPDMQGIDQSKVVPLLVATLQEALARIEALEE